MAQPKCDIIILRLERDLSLDNARFRQRRGVSWH
jgi:hypothetical protein